MVRGEEDGAGVAVARPDFFNRGYLRLDAYRGAITELLTSPEPNARGSWLFGTCWAVRIEYVVSRVSSALFCEERLAALAHRIREPLYLVARRSDGLRGLATEA
ncbi:hypothetical protein UK12_34050, partial [Saccharothrix sp. ST-888]